ncbi:MAG: hypothetical protein SPL59_07655 [Catonella sp.]|jgi:hypothetical protein|nr:hypothetical protein [Catonella sp.]
MTIRQEANQMIDTMPEDSVRILVELMQRMIPENGAPMHTGNISQYYGSMHIKHDGLELQRAMRDEWD